MKKNQPESPIELIAAIGKEIFHMLSTLPQKNNAFSGMIDLVRFSWTYRAAVLNTAKSVFTHLFDTDFIAPEFKPDKRFRHPDWQNNYLLKLYLAVTQHVLHTIRNAADVDLKDKQQTLFLMENFFDAIAPSNIPFLNPLVIEEIKKTKGINLLRGLLYWLQDINRWHGHLNISKAPPDAFQLGKNIATTPHEIIYENELMQLQYYPNHHDKEPILLMSSWINRYYIFDLKPNHSFIRWLLENDFPVFVIDWKNPTEALHDKDFADYVLQGPVCAMEQIQKKFPHQLIHAFGYCLGGTLLASAIAYLAKQNIYPFKSATFLATLLDFSNPGRFANLASEAQNEYFHASLKEHKIWRAEKMATAFNLVAANEVIWHYWIKHYLLGKYTSPYDSLYWAMDMTDTTAALYRFYIEKLYQQNALIQANQIVINEIGIDLSQINCKCFFLGLEEDYIAPWQQVYQSSKQLMNADSIFLLAPGGHFNGIVPVQFSGKGKHQRIKDEKTIQRNTAWYVEWLNWL